MRFVDSALRIGHSVTRGGSGRFRITRINLALMPVLSVALSLGGCREPQEVETSIALSAVSVDARHIDVGFPEALDPVFMSEPTEYAVEMPQHPSLPARVFAVLRAQVVDSLRGRCVRLETDSIPDGILLFVHVRTIRLLTGPTLGTRPVAVRMVTGLSYSKDIAPLFATRCNSCHSGDHPAGEYSTDNYYGLWGPGAAPPPNVPNIIPGDPRSELVIRSQPGGLMFSRGGLEFIEGSMVRNWVEAYQARPY